MSGNICSYDKNEIWCANEGAAFFAVSVQFYMSFNGTFSNHEKSPFDFYFKLLWRRAEAEISFSLGPNFIFIPTINVLIDIS